MQSAWLCGFVQLLVLQFLYASQKSNVLKGMLGDRYGRKTPAA